MEAAQNESPGSGNKETLIPPEPPEKKQSGHRRPKVKHVNSRFMSPIVASSASSSFSKLPADKHRSQSANRRIAASGEGPLCSADQNRPATHRCSETAGDPPAQRKCATQLFKENADQNLELRPPADNSHRSKLLNSKLHGRLRSRIGTPIVTPRVTPNSHRAINWPPTSAAGLLVQSGIMNSHTKLVQEIGHSSRRQPELSDPETMAEVLIADDCAASSCSESETCSIGSQPSMCDSPPIPLQIAKTRHLPELRSSLPETNLLPAASARLMAEEGNDTPNLSTVSASPCYRSLNSALSLYKYPINPTTNVHKSSAFSRPYAASSKTGTPSLPPVHPAHARSGTDLKKARNCPGTSDDIHLLKLLNNRYLQWRFANAKADATLKSQKITAERSLHAVVERVEDMRNSVNRKRIELAHLKQMQRLFAILDPQMARLVKWELMQEAYWCSLSGLVEALHNALIQLPVSGIVQVDVSTLARALSSADNIMVATWSILSKFQAKVEEVDCMMSKLAAVVSRERVYMRECADLLSVTHLFQVEECSLRTHMMQLKTRHA